MEQLKQLKEHDSRQEGKFGLDPDKIAGPSFEEMRLYLGESEAFIWCTYRLFAKLKINVNNISSTQTQGSRTCSIQDLKLGAPQQKQQKEGVDDRIVQALRMCEQLQKVFHDSPFAKQYIALFSSEA